MAITVAVRPEELLLMTQRVIYVVIGTTVAVFAVFAAAYLAGIDPVTSISFVAGAIVTIFSAGIVAIRSRFFAETFRQVAYPVEVVEKLPPSMVIFSMGIMIGGWMRSLGIRLLATIAHIREGFYALPRNWWRALFVVDYTISPEIIPGYERLDFYNVKFYETKMNEAHERWRRALYFVCKVFFFAPAYAYRIMIKSTFLFYFAMIFVVRVPHFVRFFVVGILPFLRPLLLPRMSMKDFQEYPELLVQLINKDPRKQVRWILIGISMGVISIGGALAFLIKSRGSSMDVAGIMKFLDSYHHTMTPWAWTGITVALLSVVISAEAKVLEFYIESGKRRPRLRKSMRKSIRLNTLVVAAMLAARNIATIILAVSCGGYVVLAFSPIQQHLTLEMLNMLHHFYGC
jgi:hypothetical protein